MTEVVAKESPADQALRRRIRFVAIVLLMIFPLGWIAWFAPFDDLYDRSGTPLGADFPIYYVLGRLVHEGRTRELYDFAAQQKEIRKVLPGLPASAFLPALYPPYVAALLSPLARLSYPAAFAVFLAGSLGLLVVSAAAWRRSLRLLNGHWRNSVLLTAASLPVVWETLIGGQASMIAVATISAGGCLLLSGRPISAGVALALAAYKPNVLALTLLGIFVQSPKSLIGAAPVWAGLLTLGLATVGVDGLVRYVRIPSTPEGRQALQSPPQHKFHGLAASSPWTRTEPVKLGVAVAAALSAVAVGVRWRSAGKDDRAAGCFAISLLVTLNLLGNPYTPIYDLSLLLPGAVFFAEGLVRRYGESIGSASVKAHAAIALIYFGPHLSQAAAQETGFQPFAWALLPIAVWQWREFTWAARRS